VGIAWWLGVAGAGAQEGQRVIAVEVQGAKTVAQETVLSKVQTKPGMPYDPSVISEDIRRIFALGYFADVKADVQEVAEGLQLIFLVEEKPTIKDIDVKGHRALRESRVLELFAAAKGDLYDARVVKEGVDKVKAEYHRKGFAQTEVLSDVQVDSQDNTATIYLLVNEGPKLRIRDILVEGNAAFSDRQVFKVLKTKRKRWFFSTTYSEQVIEEDMERVKAFYRKHGYQDVDASHEVYQDPAGKGLLIHVKVTEGLQHRVGQVAVEGTVLFPETEIRKLLTLKPGAVYNQEGLQEDLRLMKEYYGDRGYINAEVTPDTQLDPDTKRVDVTYHITEHELVYINRIDVQGNLHTKDVVVRRELRVYPGEAFDGKKIHKSIDRLYNLGYFEEVAVDTEPTAAANKEDLVVKVKETKTGSFSFGGGFSSVDRLMGLVELEQRNFDITNFPRFTGAGQDLLLRVEVGTVRRYFDVAFTEPWIFGYPLSFGVDVFNRTRLRSQHLGFAYEEERRGGGVRFGKEFFDLLKVNTSYQFFQTEISDVPSEASPDLRAEEGRSDVSVLGVDVAADWRNSRFDPTQGLYLSSSADLAGDGLGGDEDFYRVQGGASHYLPHGDRFVFESRLRAGLVNEYGDSSDVPIFERFFAGGSNTIRGFRERRVGPTDPSTNDPIGGETILVGTLEEVLTVIKDERGRSILRASVFYDVGNVWRRLNDFGTSFKSGAGVGARVNTPIGPVRLDVGFPVSGLGDEKRKARLHFNVSRSF
jgi:outer membrane protein insertion porin family